MTGNDRSRSPPRLVPVAEMVEYPIPREERLAGNSFTKWQHHRWLSSSMFRRASWEAQGMARALFDMAQTESPVGTLPDDDEELSFLLRVTPARVRELRAMEFGPLHGWVTCRADGELRLMHPVVLEQVRDAIERRETKSMNNGKKALTMRLNRIRAAFSGLGVDPRALADSDMIARIDEWMTATGRRHRTTADYQAALIHAGQAGWFGMG